MYVYKSFSTTLDKGLRKNIKKKEMNKLENKTKWNGSIEYEIENKLDKSKISSYSPVIFKHDCSLEKYLNLWPKKKKKQYSDICIFQKISS